MSSESSGQADAHDLGKALADGRLTCEVLLFEHECFVVLLTAVLIDCEDQRGL
jgi:hypothetical protein